VDKSYADKITAEYMEKIFGFALSKTMNTDKAEELASRIIFDVYISILKTDEINNINGYIYRVACNVYARFIAEEIRGRHISLDEVRIPCEIDFTDDFEKDDTYILLRKKISYLGKIQREIVVMHYFQRLKQYEIAERLNIPLGTVKWHLHDARNQIKNKLTEGNKMHEKINLGINPIKFAGMGHTGIASPDGKDTAYYLQKLISQNIAYAAYWKAKTITEIAENLGVSAAFVEDEVNYLEEYGFITKVAGGKYLTNIRIDEPRTKEMWEQYHKIYTKYAKIVCDKYVPLVFDAMADYKSKNIYAPEDDFNFLMLSVVTFACGHKLDTYYETVDTSKYYVKRKDGGEYIATAGIYSDKWEEVSYNTELHNSSGDMFRGCSGISVGTTWDLYQVSAWQFDTYYDDRTGLENNLTTDYQYLYEFMTGKINKVPEHADKFKRLFDRGYIVSKSDSEYVNMIVTSFSSEEFLNLLPAISEELKVIRKEIGDEIFKIDKPHYPAHMQDLVRTASTNSLASPASRTRVLEQLVTGGTLKPLTENQKHSVNTIMFCDVLPK